MMKKDTAISISKAIAIIMMVMCHAGCPGQWGRFFNEFIMPLFFMTAGYFFSTKYVDQWAVFVKKRIKGLYQPFVKWAVVFLVLHNVFFALNILNEQFGNINGGVTHPYSWHVFCQRLWNIVTAMSSYDEFLCGAFWFFRALLVAGLLYLAIFKLYDHVAGRLGKTSWRKWVIPVAVCATTLLLALWKTGENLRVLNLTQGGYRDIMGAFFFACGYLWRLAADKYKPSAWLTVVLAAVVLVFSLYMPASMEWRGSIDKCLALSLPAVCGVLMVYNVSYWIDRHDGMVRRFLVFCGNNTLYILVFHLVAFKVVSLLKIWWYGLETAQIGCHPVVHAHSDDLFWVVYTVVGVCLPLLGIGLYRTMASRIASTIKKVSV